MHKHIMKIGVKTEMTTCRNERPLHVDSIQVSTLSSIVSKSMQSVMIFDRWQVSKYKSVKTGKKSATMLSGNFEILCFHYKPHSVFNLWTLMRHVKLANAVPKS